MRRRVGTSAPQSYSWRGRVSRCFPAFREHAEDASIRHHRRDHTIRNKGRFQHVKPCIDVSKRISRMAQVAGWLRNMMTWGKREVWNVMAQSRDKLLPDKLLAALA